MNINSTNSHKPPESCHPLSTHRFPNLRWLELRVGVQKMSVMGIGVCGRAGVGTGYIWYIPVCCGFDSMEASFTLKTTMNFAIFRILEPLNITNFAVFRMMELFP